MKQLTLTIALLFITIIGFAQADKYTSAMQKGITTIDSAKTADDYTNAANYFERIATAEQKQWLPNYYVAFANLHAALVGNQQAEIKDAIYDKAMAAAEKADALSPNNSEIYALKAYIVFMKMSVSPQARAMTMIPQSAVLAEKAIALNTENPRAYMIKGQQIFYTPEAFGGGKAKAKPVLAIAAEKFDTFKAGSLLPNWGKGRNQSLLKQAN
jgi:tetratricopeptide (TPR) repeat protein